jgi:hypothetical protein
MRVIILTKGQHTVVSDHVFEWASKFKWYARPSPGGGFYAMRAIRISKGKWKTSYLHREILKATPGVFVDHKDHDGLNNLDENLRFCNNRENGRNGRKHKDNTSGFRGVFFHRIAQKWEVKVGGDGGVVYGGLYECRYDAARAYDRLAIQLHGEFACLNFPTTPP